MELEQERPQVGQRERERERQQELQLLRRKNQELAQQTKRLEEKVRSLEKVCAAPQRPNDRLINLDCALINFL